MVQRLSPHRGVFHTPIEAQVCVFAALQAAENFAEFPDTWQAFIERPVEQVEQRFLANRSDAC